MSRQFMIPFILISLSLALLFVFFPQIDLSISKLFYTQSKGFLLNRQPILLFMYYFVYWISAAMIVGFFTLLLVSLLFKKHLPYLGRRQVIFLTLALALGPGLLVNGILKDNWGRARPLHVTEFGGNKTFTPAFVITNQCERNCSFTSGHASIGFFPLAIAFLFSGVWRRRIFALGITTGILFGGARILQGAHFFSDTIFSAILTFLLYSALAWWLEPEKQA